jgi:hypothetical protein
MISVIFHLLVNDLNNSALSLASSSRLDAASRTIVKGMIRIPRTSGADWDFVLQRCTAK